VVCALFVGLLIAVRFVDAFIDIDLSKFIGLLFIAAMLALSSRCWCFCARFSWRIERGGPDR